MAQSERTRSAAKTTTRRARPRRAGDPVPAPPSGASASARPQDAPPTCTVTLCPICAVVTTVGDLRPEVAVHVVAAGREVLLALRSLIDARLQGLEEQPARLERLTIE